MTVVGDHPGGEPIKSSLRIGESTSSDGSLRVPSGSSVDEEIHDNDSVDGPPTYSLSSTRTGVSMEKWSLVDGGSLETRGPTFSPSLVF